MLFFYLALGALAVVGLFEFVMGMFLMLYSGILIVAITLTEIACFFRKDRK